MLPLRRATYSAFATAVIFWILFQLSKIRAIQDASPFANDPYDAVASFAFQIAMLLGLLSVARLLNIRDEAGRRARAPFILHGIFLLELCVLATLIADAVALAGAWPLPLSQPLLLQYLGLAILMALFTLTAVLVLRAWRENHDLTASAPADALGQTIRDCWGLVVLIATRLVGWAPFLAPAWRWGDRLARRIAGSWKRHLSFADPDVHPWYFAVTFAALAGVLIMAGILLAERFAEGPPASVHILLLLMLIFFSAETAAILLSFLLFGGYLGLRPKL
jgi:hypothetical protein